MKVIEIYVSNLKNSCNKCKIIYLFIIQTAKRGPPADFLRTQCNSILSRLLRQATKFSKAYFRNMVKSTKLHELMEFFHAFVGFCKNPNSLLSPLSKFNKYLTFYSLS